MLSKMARALTWAVFVIFINGASHAQTTDPVEQIHALYEEFLLFKNDPDFHAVGFDPCCRYHEWLQKVEALKQHDDVPTAIRFADEFGMLPSGLVQLARLYAAGKGDSKSARLWEEQLVVMSPEAAAPPLTVPAREEGCPTYPRDKIEIAVAGIRQQSLVRDAAIVQEGCLLKLAILANPIITEDHAEQLGDNFVRLTKTLGPGLNPRKEIGAGIYEYMVGVYEAGSQKSIVLGAKAPRGRSIRW